MENDDRLSVSTMSDGGVIEAVDCELQKVMDNIIDPNTEAETKREVILKIIFTPGKNRAISAFTAQAFAKLAPDTAIKVADVTLPPTVTLFPFSTFTEINQPERMFTFRMSRRNDTIYCKLIPADGNAWKNTCMERIADFLKSELNNAMPVIY